MKILIADDGPLAHHFIREAFGKALSVSGYETMFWDIRKKPVYDAFDQFEPDLVFLQGYNLTESTVKCIEERPEMKIVMRVSDWSEFNDEIIDEYPVIKAGEKEINFLNHIKTLPNKLLLQTHHCKEYLELTHQRWIDNGFNLYAFENFGDVFEYTNGEYIENLSCDLIFIGGYWGYKARNLDKYIMPLCDPNKNYNLRIFGNQRWPGSKYCGFIPQDISKHALKSSKICLSVHEPHSNKFGYDIVVRPYNLMLNKCLMISDYVEGLVKRFPEANTYKTPDDYISAIDRLLSHTEFQEEKIEHLYQEVLTKHTAFERMTDIFSMLDIPTDKIKAGKELVMEKLSL